MNRKESTKPMNDSATGRRALITGVTGQDGSYLAELLLDKGYEVWGVVRRSSTMERARIDHLHHPGADNRERFKLVYGDLGDASSLFRIVEDVQPDEVYNLGAAESHVRVSFRRRRNTPADVVGHGNVAAAPRDHPAHRADRPEGALLPGLLVGDVREGARKTPQRETTPLLAALARMPAAKVYAFELADA